MKNPEELNLPGYIASAARIRTLKMTESESVALPFGDSAIICLFWTASVLYISFTEKSSVFFVNIQIPGKKTDQDGISCISD